MKSIEQQTKEAVAFMLKDCGPGSKGYCPVAHRALKEFMPVTVRFIIEESERGTEIEELVAAFGVGIGNVLRELSGAHGGSPESRVNIINFCMATIGNVLQSAMNQWHANSGETAFHDKASGDLKVITHGDGGRA